jgi:4-amino-4-deoxy-L-arabinose transferase-like glycosyltransferase
MELCDDLIGGVVSARPRDLRRSVVFIALVLTAVRLLAAYAIPLTEDEAYYRLWAQHLQPGYYDHPPMIAWWIWLGEKIAGDTQLGVRLLPALAAGLTTWFVGDLARRLGATQATAARAALWYNATFTIGLGGMLAIPDSPACLFWAATLWCLAREWKSGRAVWWLAAGAAAGLSALSKYSGLFLAPGVLLWMLLRPGGRAMLARPWPWMAAVVAGLVFAPNIVWNAGHHWVTFAKQFGRVGAPSLQLGHLPEFLVGQFVLLNPLIAVYAAVGAWIGWRERKSPTAPNLLLPLAVAAPFAVYMLIHSLHDRVQGHWPVPLFGTAALCAAVAAERWGRGRWQLAAPVVGLTVAALALVHLAFPRTGYFGVFDPTLAVRDWPQFAGEVEQLRQTQGAAWVGTESYGVMSQLSAQRQITAPLLQVDERDRYWPSDPRPDFGRPGLIVDLSRRMDRDDLLRCFSVVEPAGELERGGKYGPDARYTAFRVAAPRVDVWTAGCP